MSDWLDDIHNGMRGLHAVNYELESLASAFRRVGNNDVADELLFIVDELRENQKLVNGAVSTSINERLSDSQKMTGSIISNVFGIMNKGNNE